MKSKKHNWIKLKRELEDRLEKAVPADLKDYVGLVDGKGYCDLCRQKKVLFVDRATKKSLCIDCDTMRGYEYTAIEFNNMWQLVQDTLFYADEIIMELMYPNLDFTPITPEKVVAYLVNRGWVEEPVKNLCVRRFCKNYKNMKMYVHAPKTVGLVDYHHTVEFAIEIISKVESLSPYEVFKEVCSC